MENLPNYFWLIALTVFVICAVAFAYGLLILIKLAKEIRGGGDKREVTITDDCICKSDFEKFADKNDEVHGQIFAKLGGVERGVEERLTRRLESIALADKESRLQMHMEMTALTKQVAAQGANLETTNLCVVRMDGKLDRLIERRLT